MRPQKDWNAILEKKSYTDKYSQSHDYSKLKANKIIKECIEQNTVFKKRQAMLDWEAIHQAHYDWWAFPIDERSSHGNDYKLTQNQIQIMRQNPQFMAALKSNAIIVCKAWGWDLKKGEKIITDHKDQRWHNWPIRLYKMCRSLEIFEVQILFENAVKYGITIIKESGKPLRYGKRDISAYLMSKWPVKKSHEATSLKQNLKPSYSKFQSEKISHQSLGKKEYLGNYELSQKYDPKHQTGKQPGQSYRFGSSGINYQGYYSPFL